MFFRNQTFTDSNDITICRPSGYGIPITLCWRNNSSVEPKFYNNTITSGGNTMFTIDGPDMKNGGETCPAGSKIHLRNNILLGGRTQSGANITALFYNSAFGDYAVNCIPEVRLTDNACTGEFSQGNCTASNTANAYLRTAVSGNVYTTTPGDVFTGTILQGPTTYYSDDDYINQMGIEIGSIARNIADETILGTDAVDFNNFNRGASWDAGGLEYGTIGQSAGVAPCSSQTITNCDLDATASGSSDGTCSSGYTGACSYSCTDGDWTLSSNTCVIQDCGNAQSDAGEEYGAAPAG